ncbi:MAG: hypothetical protein KF812_01210 [Fimbriimonadaceae bacterium]|nr:hypothetical protein [Fimbriimonadaceae bacterium]
MAENSSPRVLTADDLKRLKWRSVGPAVMGGRVSDIAFAPGNSRTFFAGYATGGLFRTKNNGISFDSLFDFEENTSIGSVAVADLAPDSSAWTDEEKDGKSKKELKEAGKARVIWVGTGEGNGRNSSSWGNGVYRSTDGGKKWKHCGLEDSHDIPCIVVDPRDAETCYVAALGHLWGANEMRGVYKTTDGGESWEKVLGVDENNGCCWLAMHPDEPDTLFAVMYERRRTAYSFRSGGTKGGLFKSTDAGKSWTKITNGLPKTAGRMCVDIFRANPKIVYALIESSEGGSNSIRDDRSKSGGLFRSEDGGESWERMSVRVPRGFYFCKVKIHPTDDQKIYLPGWDVEVSTDGGRTFRGGWGDKAHVDMHAFAFDPNDPDHIVFGSDGGIYQTFDGGEKWQFLNTLATGQFYNIVLDDSDPYRIAGGLQDNGSWVGPSGTNRESEEYTDGTPRTGITNADWQFINWGDGFHCAFDPTDKNVLYAEWQGGNVVRTHLDTGERLHLAPQQAEGGVRFRFNWNSPFFVSHHNPTTLYLGGNYVFKLTDRGDKWTRISNDLSHNDPATIETVGSSAETFATVVALSESSLKKGHLWAGTDDGRIHRTTNDGKAWSEITPDAVSGMYVSRIESSHFDVERAYASVDGHRSDWMDPMILATHDGGANWLEVTGDLPSGRSVKVVREDMSNEQVLYCGTENGVYVSVDQGQSWIRMNAKTLPHCPVDDIQQHTRERDLVLGTHGRSIYILDDAGFLSECTPENLEKPLHVFSCRPAKPKFMLWYQGLWQDQVFRAENPPKFSIITYWLRESVSDPVKISIKNDKGLEVYETSGSAFAGVNRVTWDCQPKEIMRRFDQGEEPWHPFFVAPGTYKVDVTCGDLKSFTSLEVRPALAKD